MDRWIGVGEGGSGARRPPGRVGHPGFGGLHHVGGRAAREPGLPGQALSAETAPEPVALQGLLVTSVSVACTTLEGERPASRAFWVRRCLRAKTAPEPVALQGLSLSRGCVRTWKPGRVWLCYASGK